MTKQGCGCESLAPAGFFQHVDRTNGEDWTCPRCLTRYILVAEEWVSVRVRGKKDRPAIRGPQRSPTQEVRMTTPAAPSTALAPLTNGLPFTEEEWGQMSELERRDATKFFREEVAATTKGLTVTFPRAKFPTSGSSFWEIPSVTGEPEATKEIEGVVVFKQNTRAWWGDPKTQETSFEITNSAPTCSSLDGVTPIESPGRQAMACAGCPHSAWGTGKEGRGQACKSRLNVFILRPGDEIPTLISLPPTAIKPFGAYAVGLRQKKSALIATTTIFGLQKAKSSGGTDYTGIALRMGKPLSFADMKAARAISDAFESAMAQRGIAVDEAVEEGAEPGAEG